MFFKYALYVTIFVPISYCANILGIMPTPSYSHQIVYTPLWKELSLRGHNVTVITTNPVRDPKLVNLTEIDIHFVYTYFANISKIGENTLTMWNIHEVFTEIASSQPNLLHGRCRANLDPLRHDLLDEERMHAVT
ncbi:hypothetical protein NQ318_021883 [Aromia moschata]|uniref:Uncharacterized protein n=1 Tax=Aromia moschata TaxID=1265417 RepID=A0AAV8Z6M9_9CUCU|nr:hypothetical protein NQ318_021883 [Aromia moschata]